MKKFLTVIISIVMFFSILSFTILFSIKNVFSKDKISEILNVGMENIEKDSLIDDIFNSNKDTKELGKYVDADEFSKAFTDYMAEYIMYATMDSDKQVSSENLRNIINDSINKYEKENDVTLDNSVIDELFDTFDKEMEESKNEITDTEEVRLIFDFIYSDYYLIALAISIVCLILIFVINMSIKTVCTSLGVVTIINGVIVYLLSLVIKVAFEIEESVKALGNVISSPYRIASYISIGLGIVLLITKTYIKEKKEEIV